MDCDLYSDLSLYNLELSDYRTAKGKITKLFTPDTNPGYNEYGWGNTYKLSEKKMDEWNDGSEAEAAIRRHTIENWDNIDHNYAMMITFKWYSSQLHAGRHTITIWTADNLQRCMS